MQCSLLYFIIDMHERKKRKIKAGVKESKRKWEERRGRETLHKGEAWIKSWVASDIGWIFKAWDHILFPKQRRNSSWSGQNGQAEYCHYLSLSRSLHVRICVCVLVCACVCCVHARVHARVHATNRTSITEQRQWHAALAMHKGGSTHVSKLRMQGHSV